MGQLRGRGRADVAETDGLDQFTGPRDPPAVGGGRPEEAETVTFDRLQCQLDRLAGGEAVEYRRDLIRASNARMDTLGQREPRDVAVVQHHTPRIRCELTAELGECGRLAGAVGADQRMNLAATQIQVEFGRDLQGTVRLAQRNAAQLSRAGMDLRHCGAFERPGPRHPWGQPARPRAGLRR